MPATPDLEPLPALGYRPESAYQRVVRRGMRLRRERHAVLAMGLAAVSLLAVAFPLALSDDAGSRLQTTASSPTTLPQSPTTRGARDSQSAVAVAPGLVLPGTLTTTPTTAPLRPGLGVLSPYYRPTRRGGPAPNRPLGSGGPTTTAQPATGGGSGDGGGGGAGGGGGGGSNSTAPPNTSPANAHPACAPSKSAVRPHDNVLFARGGDIWMVDTNDKTVTQATTDIEGQPPDVDASPTWAPNGLAFAFTRNGAIFTQTTRGALTQLTVGPDLDLAYSPDGKYIAFVRDGDLYRVTVSTKKVDPIFNFGPTAPASSPTWSPDSCQLSVASAGGVWRVDRDGDNLRKIHDGESPSWSVSDNRIAYVLLGQIFTMGSDGEGEASIAEGTAPSYPGPDLAFVRDGNVFVTGAGGQLTEGPADGEPAW